MPDRAIEIVPEYTDTHFPNVYGRDFMNSPDTLWLRVTPKSFLPNVNNARVVNEGGTISRLSLNFLLGQSFTTSLNHDWDDLTTVASAIREVVSNVKEATSQLGAVVDGVGVSDSLNKYRAGKRDKNDTPFVYKNTQRRNFTIEVNFVAHSDPKREVWTPIQNLMIWSCAGKELNKETEYRFPYVFQVHTVSGDGKFVELVNFNNAALTAVQPQYEEPYKNGYPMRASCQLTFTDIDPVYKSSITQKGQITARSEG